MKIWLDDVRKPPNASWKWARSYEEAQAWWIGDNDITEVSLDHDLGNGRSGYDFLMWLLEVPNGPVIHVHSMNPVGRVRMLAAIAAARPGAQGGGR